MNNYTKVLSVLLVIAGYKNVIYSAQQQINTTLWITSLKELNSILKASNDYIAYNKDLTTLIKRKFAGVKIREDKEDDCTLNDLCTELNKLNDVIETNIKKINFYIEEYNPL